jgi:hypothetical protein
MVKRCELSDAQWQRLKHCFQPRLATPAGQPTPLRFAPASRPRPEKGDQNQALGRSRGGLTSKIPMLADALGRPLRFILTGGPSPRWRHRAGPARWHLAAGQEAERRRVVVRNALAEGWVRHVDREGAHRRPAARALREVHCEKSRHCKGSHVGRAWRQGLSDGTSPAGSCSTTGTGPARSLSVVVRTGNPRHLTKLLAVAAQTAAAEACDVVVPGNPVRPV